MQHSLSCRQMSSTKEMSSLIHFISSFLTNVPCVAREYLCQALANLGEDGLVFNVLFVVGLELSGNTIQGTLEGILR